MRILPALLIALIAAPAAAQTASAPPATTPRDRAADEQAVLKVVQTTFDGMRLRDTTLLRAAMDSSARIIMTFTREGKPAKRVVPAAEFISMVAGLKEPVTETIYDPEVRISDNLATVWAEYDVHVGTRFSHCGVDAIQLARGDAGWKIVHITDTQRREECPTRK